MSAFGLRTRILALVAMIGASYSLRAEVRCVPLTHPGPCDSRYATIQQAVDQAAGAGDTIRVAAGSYPERVVVSGKSLQLLGARAGEDARGRTGPESVIVHPDGPLAVCGDDDVVDGFTLTGATNTDGAWAAVLLDPAPCGATGGARIENNIVRDSIVGIFVQGVSTATKLIRSNWILNNSVLPEFGNGIECGGATNHLRIENNLLEGNPASSMALYGNPLADAVIVGNRFDRRILVTRATSVRLERNVSVGSAAPDGLIAIAGGADGVVVTRNTLRPISGRSIVIADLFSVGSNQNVSARENCVGEAGVVGLDVSAAGYAGPLDASSNWWGSASGPSGAGPGTGAALVDPGAHVAFSPFQSESSCDCPGRPDGASCDYWNPCATDACAGGICIAMPTDCDDDLACTVDRCVPETGACENTPIVCQDENPCTDDACDPSGACAFTPDDTNACPDPGPCRVGACSAGVCLSNPQVCDDGNACTTDSCNSVNDQCVFTPKTCNDNNPCTDDSCASATGSCVFTADDSNPCTNPSTCSLDHCSAGACVPSGGPAFCDDGVACTTDSCNTGTGLCQHVFVHSMCGQQGPCAIFFCGPAGCYFNGAAEGNFCSDGNVCTLGDRCHGGSCGPIAGYMQCGSCHRCDPAIGCTPDVGFPCEDGNPCTWDSCNASGACQGVPVGAPPEVTGVTFAADRRTLTWNPSPLSWWPGFHYDLARGTVAGLPVGSNLTESCLALGDTAAATVAEVPGTGRSTWYLLRARHDCGVGTYGYAGIDGSPATERIPNCP